MIFDINNNRHASLGIKSPWWFRVHAGREEDVRWRICSCYCRFVVKHKHTQQKHVTITTSLFFFCFYPGKDVRFPCVLVNLNIPKPPPTPCTPNSLRPWFSILCGRAPILSRLTASETPRPQKTVLKTFAAAVRFPPRWPNPEWKGREQSG